MKNPLPIWFLTLLLLVGVTLCRPAAAVTVTIGLDGVRDGNQTFAPTSTLALLVVRSGAGAFVDPIPGASLQTGTYLSGSTGDGSYIAWKGNFDGQTPGSGQAGVFFNAISFNLGSADLPANAALAVYWFPSMTTMATSLGQGVAYGMYSSGNAMQFGSNHAWDVGSDNSASFSLNAFAMDNTGLYAPSNPALDGLDDVTLSATKVAAVPEPSTAMLLMAAFGAVMCSARLRSPPRGG